MYADTTIPPPTSQNFHVVGVGASAGGLNAFKKFISAIKVDSGMAYVLVQHLSPKHESILPEILANETVLPVHEIKDEINLAPNHIYIIPENKMLLAVDGALKLLPRNAAEKPNMPIDLFFSSLADAHKTFAIGVILSGAAFDGTIGLKRIKELGGTTFAQDPTTAGYSSMPGNAISADAVDFVLPVEKIPEQLLQIKEAYEVNHGHIEDEHLSRSEEDLFKQILRVLRLRTGNDFSHYKQATLRRRIARRMVLTDIEEPAAYLGLLKADKNEQDALFNDILIPVTYFFRDQGTFDTIKELVFPLIFKNKKPGDKIRFWSAGCSTGEEPYSLAICLHEYLSQKKLDVQVQIFASDVSERVIQKARIGLYSRTELENVSDERLQQYFTKVEGNYIINKNIREMCVFAVHNFIKAPPFAKLDLITCRNVLIYLDPVLQSKALTTFHYSLNNTGVLVLGKSETESSAAGLFMPIIKSDKIYTKKLVPGVYPSAAVEKADAFNAEKRFEQPTFIPQPPNFQKVAYDIIFNKYTPAGVIVNDNKDIVHFHGDTSPFLLPSPGKPNFSVLKMARESLAFELRNAILKVQKTLTPVTREDIPLTFGNEDYTVTIEVMPLPSDEDIFYLILFTKSKINSKSAGRRPQPKEDLRVKQLEAELTQLRQDIRDITEEQEAAIEELQSANEELLSGSEELQTLNEELETSAEELQSNNEELISVNDELMDRQEQLTVARNYAEAIVTTIREPLVVIDQNLQIKTANDSFYSFFSTQETEVEGRFLHQLQQGQWDSGNLQQLLREVIKNHQDVENFEFSGDFPVIGKRTLLLNARPILNGRYGDPLVLVAFEDITHSRHYNLLKESEERFRTMANATPMMLWMTKTNVSVRMFNSAWLKFTGRDIKKEELSDWQNEIHPEDRLNTLAKYQKSFDRHKEFTLEYRLRKADGSYSWVADRGVPRHAPDGKFIGFIGGSADIQIQKEFSATLEQQVNARTEELSRSQAFLKSVLNSTRYGIASYEAITEGDEIVDFKIVYTNSEVPHTFGLEPEDVTGKTCREIYPGLFENGVFEKMVHCMKTGESGNYEVMVTQDGTDMWLTASLEKVNNTVTVTSKNITKEKNDALHLQAMNKLLGNKNRELEQRILTEFSESFASYKAGAEFFNFLVQELSQKTKMDYVLVGERISTEAGDEVRPFAVCASGELIKNKSYYSAHGACNEVMKGKTYESVKGVRGTFPKDDTFQSLDIEGYIGLPLKDNNQNVIGVICVMHRSEIRNPAYIESLMKIAARRCEMEISRQRNERMLAEKNVELERNNKELESFNYIASHDLQEPLRKIQLFCSRILDKDQKKLSETSIRYFDSVNNAADRMQNLIDALLSYSTVNNSEMTFEMTDLNTVIFEAVTDLEDVISSKNGTVKVPNKLPKISAIPIQIRQLFANLISNGIKYSKNDVAPEIIITSDLVEENFIKYLKISIADNGIGFEQQYANKIFELFQRLHGKIDYVGTGIGLAICKKIAQNHNGFIKVTSEPGVGSTFCVFIPI
ncbi:MAG TPA: CheR family methyltransferase [Flavobacterium sp.]